MWTFANINALEVIVLDASRYQLSLTRTMLSHIGVRRTRSYERPIDALGDMMAEPGGLLIIDSDLPMSISSLRLIYGLRDPAMVPICFTPIILTASEPTKTFVEQAIHHGVNSVLVKPYSPSTLKHRIQRVLADRDKLVLKDGRYVVAEILDTMEARALSSDPSMLATILHGDDASGTSPAAAMRNMIDMLQADTAQRDAMHPATLAPRNARLGARAGWA